MQTTTPPLKTRLEAYYDAVTANYSANLHPDLTTEDRTAELRRFRTQLESDLTLPESTKRRWANETVADDWQEPSLQSPAGDGAI